MGLSAPQQNGDLLSQADVLEHTMVVCPTEFIPHIQTVNTKPGEQSPAIRVNVVDFSGAGEDGNPIQYSGVLWFGVISGSLKRQIGQSILGRMSKGQATPGKNAPWQLMDIMNETAWVDYATQWLDSEVGVAWEQANAAEIVALANNASTTSQVAAAAAPTQSAPAVSAPPSAPPARTAPPAGPPSAPAGPPATAPSAPPAAAPATAALPAGLEALIAAMPLDQQAAARAIMAAQSGAAS